MKNNHDVACPECQESSLISMNRRRFIETVGAGAGSALAIAVAPGIADAAPATDQTREPKPAEALIRELYVGMNPWQREHLVYPWDHRGGGTRGGNFAQIGQQELTRLGTYNTPFGKAVGESYSKAQRELIEKIMFAMSSGEEGYEKISRNGRWDSQDGILSGGAYIFGDPTGDGKFCFLFAGHHITLRCDGNSLPGTAFGGPIFYGHLPAGYSDRNCFNFQTKKVMEVFDALDEKQRRQAMGSGRPSEGSRAVQFRDADEAIPGIDGSELSADQKALIRDVMRTVLSPYRKEDVDEVMEIVKHNGGVDKVHLAFFGDQSNEQEPWSHWRLEGPGFIWSFRVLPHVHTYINIAKVNS